MKRLLVLLFLLTPFARPQSDCGNCWLIGWACNGVNKDSECYTPNVPCQACAWYFDCDDHACAYSTGLQCVCLALNTPKCIRDKAKQVALELILKQKIKNRSIFAHS